eukprot:gnl/TRDRNA2_/TRDRNA2_27570_c0_seq1.p1 gnl/TRDRNA2_/TRDRNA2_27570_c0~~gnl/TRDRNA2_/TRDRNA2_27570_c0_seq1.p1  ORF type:complete len:202 (-),score=23.94 gnl/TRDRNA2_/TRDRNA2_27570_c0_seq1:135-740(-)
MEPLDTKAKLEIYAHNRMKARSASFLNQHVIYKRLQFPAAHKDDLDYAWQCKATTFARGGLWSKGKQFHRDPASGTWFKDDSAGRRREFHNCNSEICMRYTDKAGPRDKASVHYNVIAAPCAGGFFIEKSSDSYYSERGDATNAAPLAHVPHWTHSFGDHPFYRSSAMGGEKERGPAFTLARKRPNIGTGEQIARARSGPL